MNYYREHIPHLAEKATSLYALTGKAPFKWTEEHHLAFCALREALMLAEVLALPRKGGIFVLDTDASNVAVGGVLSQMQDKFKANSFRQ